MACNSCRQLCNDKQGMAIAQQMTSLGELLMARTNVTKKQRGLTYDNNNVVLQTVCRSSEKPILHLVSHPCIRIESVLSLSS